jgi:hypothetical protein
MLGALGGVTIAAMILSSKGLKPGVLVFWLLFAAAVTIHTVGGNWL